MCRPGEFKRDLKPQGQITTGIGIGVHNLLMVCQFNRSMLVEQGVKIGLRNTTFNKVFSAIKSQDCKPAKTAMQTTVRKRCAALSVRMGATQFTCVMVFSVSTIPI